MSGAILSRSDTSGLSARERVLFYSKRDKNGCWIWQGKIDAHGYGAATYKGKWYLAHRISYELFLAPIPAGLTLDHMCNTRNCINPKHLQPVTLVENIKLASTRRWSFNSGCKNGHPLTEENIKLDKRGYRACRQCNAISAKAYRERLKEKAENRT